jgi:twinkle protein
MLEHQVRSEINRYGQGQHKIVCPSCNQERKKKGERTLSLMVYEDRAVYQCWHCQQQGILPLKDKPIKVERAVAIAKKLDMTELSDEAAKWLISRKISQATAKKLGMKSCNHFIRAAQGEVPCVTFSYLNEGHEYAQKIRWTEGKGFACNGSPQHFWNIHNVRAGDWMIICEGEVDAATMVEAGYESAVSIPNGAPIKVVDGDIDPEDDDKFKYVWNAKQKLDLADRIVICTDADGPGQAAAEELARRIGKDRCWQVSFPDGCKDANDVWLAHGQDGIDKLISEAKPWPVAGLYDSEHFFGQLDDIYENGLGRGHSTGYQNVDELLTIQEGQLTVVTGHPSSGKSEFIDQIMVNIAQQSGWKFAICSFENEPRLHISKLISKYTRKPFFDGYTKRMDQQDFESGKKFVQSHFSFLYQADGSFATIESIIERLKAAVMRHGVRGAIIDPYNYIQRSADVSETEWISHMLTQLRVFAQGYGIHIWFVAHPTKMTRGADGKVPAPRGYDISGSAAWFAKADIGLTVHRPDPAKSPVSEIICWKCRFSWIGKQGQTPLVYNVASSSYSETSEIAGDDDDPF